MQSLQRLRELAGIVLLVVLGLRLVLGVVALMTLGSFSLASPGVDALVALLLAAVVASCLLGQPTPHARPLALAALVLLGLGLVFAAVEALVWLTSAALTTAAVLGFLRYAVLFALPLLGMVGLWRVLTGSSAELAAGAPPVETRLAGVDDGDRRALEGARPTDPADEPTWQPDQAAGAAWLTAGDAATGAAASGWGTTEQGGWVPNPISDTASAPTSAPRQHPSR